MSERDQNPYAAHRPGPCHISRPRSALDSLLSALGGVLGAAISGVMYFALFLQAHRLGLLSIDNPGLKFAVVMTPAIPFARHAPS